LLPDDEREPPAGTLPPRAIIGPVTTIERPLPPLNADERIDGAAGA